MKGSGASGVRKDEYSRYSLGSESILNACLDVAPTHGSSVGAVKDYKTNMMLKWWFVNVS